MIKLLFISIFHFKIFWLSTISKIENFKVCQFYFVCYPVYLASCIVT